MTTTPTAPLPPSIELDHVIALGNIDASLASFYSDAVTGAAARTGVSEREIRSWIEDELISEQGFRTQTLRGPANGAAAVVVELENAHVIRADSRRGAQWYELAHDRLVAPVRESNAAWRAAHLAPLQVEAMAWHREGRPAELLATGAALGVADVWAEAHGDELLPVDQDYLEASRERERGALLAQRASRRARILAGSVIGLLVVALLGGWIAYREVRSGDQLQGALDDAAGARADAEVEAANALAAKVDADAARRAAEDARVDAEEQAQRAERLRGSADAARDDAQFQAGEALAAKEDADLQRDAALISQAEAERQREAAEAARAEAERQREAAEAARAEAERQREAAEAAGAEADLQRQAAIEAEAERLLFERCASVVHQHMAQASAYINEVEAVVQSPAMTSDEKVAQLALQIPFTPVGVC